MRQFPRTAVVEMESWGKTKKLSFACSIIQSQACGLLFSTLQGQFPSNGAPNQGEGFETVPYSEQEYAGLHC